MKKNYNTLPEGLVCLLLKELTGPTAGRARVLIVRADFSRFYNVLQQTKLDQAPTQGVALQTKQSRSTGLIAASPFHGLANQLPLHGHQGHSIFW